MEQSAKLEWSAMVISIEILWPADECEHRSTCRLFASVYIAYTSSFAQPDLTAMMKDSL